MVMFNYQITSLATKSTLEVLFLSQFNDQQLDCIVQSVPTSVSLFQKPGGNFSQSELMVPFPRYRRLAGYTIFGRACGAVILPFSTTAPNGPTMPCHASESPRTAFFKRDRAIG